MNRNALVLSLLTVAAPAAALAQAPATVPEPTQQEISYARGLSHVFQSVARKLDPSVVHITQLNRVYQVRRDFFGFPMSTGPSRLQPTGLGSGVIVTADGYILTNNHVAKDAESLVVRLTNGAEYPARLIGRDEATDLAVIKIDAADLPAATLADSDSLEVGEWVMAIGSPFGFSSSVTAGIVSAKGRSGIAGLQEYQDFIQTDAVINPGNSGGPLINLDGKVVGINSAIASRTGGSEGISFAIPSNVARPVMQMIMKTGRVSRGWMGVELAMDPDSVGKPGVQPRVRVQSVVPGSPADRAGLKPGDTVLSYQGRPIDDVDHLRTAIALTAPESKVSIEVSESGTHRTVTAELGDQSRQRAAALGAAYADSAGLTVRTIPADVAQELDEKGGVEVLSVEPGSRAERAHVQPGDVIVEVNRRAIRNAEDFTQTLSRASYPRGGVRLSVIRPSDLGGVQRGYLTLQD